MFSHLDLCVQNFSFEGGGVGGCGLLDSSDVHLAESEAGEHHDRPYGHALLFPGHPLPEAGEMAEWIAYSVASAELVQYVELLR